MTKLHTYNGQRYLLAELAEIAGVPYNTFRQRLHEGWPIERAMTTPHGLKRGGRPASTYSYDGKTLTLPQWSKVIGIDHRTLRYRLKCGWTVEQTLTTPLLRLHRKQGAADPAPGVCDDFLMVSGTGAGSAAQAMAPENNFSRNEAWQQ